MTDIVPVVVSTAELAASNPDTTDFAKVKEVLSMVETGVEEAFDDALVIATKIGGDVEGKMRVLLNVAGFAVPAFEDIVAFVKKHA